MGDVKELYVIDPRYVRIERRGPGEPLIYYVKIRIEGGGTYEQILDGREIMHIPDFRLPGQRYGLSPIAACRTTIGSAMAADTYAASYFGNAANPGGVISVPGEMTEEQAADIARDWNISHTGPYRAGKIGILSGGTITYGRNDFFEATQPSYCNIELLNKDGASPVVELLDVVIIEVTNSAGAFVKLFTGEVAGVYNRLEAAGAGGKPNTLQIQAIGALGLLVKRIRSNNFCCRKERTS